MMHGSTIKSVIVAIAVMVEFFLGTTTSHGQRLVPDEKGFQTGDLVWPKNRGNFVPYTGRPADNPENSRGQWEKERSEFLNKVHREGDAVPSNERKLASQLEQLSYEEFQSLYLGNRQYGTPVPFGFFPVYVGHVGILLIEDGNISVVEAIPPSVRRISYGDWINERSSDIWHGRLVNTSPEERAAIARTALSQVGKRYDFWNLNLSDEGGFYCSKLVWWAVYKTLGIAIDNNPDPVRDFWLSPKQLMAVQWIELIFKPSKYQAP